VPSGAEDEAVEQSVEEAWKHPAMKFKVQSSKFKQTPKESSHQLPMRQACRPSWVFDALIPWFEPRALNLELSDTKETGKHPAMKFKVQSSKFKQTPKESSHQLPMRQACRPSWVFDALIPWFEPRALNFELSDTKETGKHSAMKFKIRSSKFKQTPKESSHQLPMRQACRPSWVFDALIPWFELRALNFELSDSVEVGLA
jgi:hypothetical protein